MSDSSNTDPANIDPSPRENHNKSPESTKSSGNHSNLIVENLFSVSALSPSAHPPGKEAPPAKNVARLNTNSPLSSSQIKSDRKSTEANKTDGHSFAHEALPFRITLVVGLSLLCLNIVAFSAVCLVKRYHGHPSKKCCEHGQNAGREHEGSSVASKDGRSDVSSEYLNHSNDNFLKSPALDERVFPNRDTYSAKSASVGDEGADPVRRDVLLRNLDPSPDRPLQILSPRVHLHRESLPDAFNKLRRNTRDKGVILSTRSTKISSDVRRVRTSIEPRPVSRAATNLPSGTNTRYRVPALRTLSVSRQFRNPTKCTYFLHFSTLIQYRVSETSSRPVILLMERQAETRRSSKSLQFKNSKVPGN